MGDEMEEHLFLICKEQVLEAKLKITEKEKTVEDLLCTVKLITFYLVTGN